MITLSREFRFSLVPAKAMRAKLGSNNWGGWPAASVLAPYLIVRSWLVGQADPQTGYLCNIKVMDDLLQSVAVEYLIPEFGDRPWELTGERAVAEIYRRVADRWRHQSNHEQANLGKLTRVELQLTPTLCYAIESERNETEQDNLKQDIMVHVTQQFEFSAAHRLNCPSMTDEENRAYFGKCNNPNGHGHNYVFEVTVAGPPSTVPIPSEVNPAEVNPAGSTESPASQGTDLPPIDLPPIDLHHFESVVKREIVDRLDHQHLNQDVEYFQTINPSVENIATAIFKWLDGQFIGLELVKVRVYETPKTWAEKSAHLMPP